MASHKRIYKVNSSVSGKDRLVNANSQAAALKHVVSSEYTTELATQHDLAKLVAAGVQVEEVKE